MQDSQRNPGNGPHNGRPRNPPRGGWWRLVLVASLALNLLLLGLLAGGALQAWQTPAQPALAEMRALWQVLPAETRRSLRSDFQRRDGAERGIGQARQGAAMAPALPALLRAEPFDDAALASAMQAARTQRAERALRAEQALARHLAALPAEERAAIADKLEERLERRPRRGQQRQR